MRVKSWGLLVALVALLGAQSAASGSVASRAIKATNGPLVYIGQDSPSNDQLFTIPPAGAPARQITTGNTFPDDPSFSPDGTAVVYLANDGSGHQQLFTIPMTGGTPHQVTTGTTNSLDSPTFSPDASRIAYTNVVSGQRQIYIVPASGGTPTQITSGTTLIPDDPGFSPDGTKVAFDAFDPSSASGQDQIFTVPAMPGGTPTRVTNDAGTGGNFDPKFSRDGSKITFDAPDLAGNEQIYVIGSGAVNRTSTRLTNDTNKNFDPIFSPDGTRIAYKVEFPANFQLYTIPSGGGTPVPLTTNATSHDDPDWGATLVHVLPTLTSAHIGKKFPVKRSKHKHHKVKRGTTIRYTLSEAANVALRIDRVLVGRQAKKHGKRVCVKRTDKNRKHKHCTLLKRAGTLNRASAAGVNQFKFNGRIGGKALKPGRYRLTIVATDSAGDKSAPIVLSFQIVKP